MVKAIVVPLRAEYEIADIEACLRELAELSLVTWYWGKNAAGARRRYLFMNQFQRHQRGLTKSVYERETASTCPTPKGAQSVLGVSKRPTKKEPAGPVTMPSEALKQRKLAENGRDPQADVLRKSTITQSDQEQGDAELSTGSPQEIADFRKTSRGEGRKEGRKGSGSSPHRLPSSTASGRQAASPQDHMSCPVCQNDPPYTRPCETCGFDFSPEAWNSIDELRDAWDLIVLNQQDRPPEEDEES